MSSHGSAYLYNVLDDWFTAHDQIQTETQIYVNDFSVILEVFGYCMSDRCRVLEDGHKNYRRWQ